MFCSVRSRKACGISNGFYRFFGRAFDPFELSGDQCVSVLGEVRVDVPILTNELTMAQLYGFADHGALFRNDVSVGTPAEVTGTSAGAGMRFCLFEKLDVDLQAAKPIEGRPDNDWRFFFSIGARY
jgi:hemolysin activation/secretion protein